MWTISLLKNNAKQVLRTNYTRVLAICSIVSLSAWLVNEVANLITTAATGLLDTPLLLFSPLLQLIAWIIGLLWSVFAASVLEIGRCRFLMETRYGQSPTATLFAGFDSRYYLNLLAASFTTNIRIALWALLLLVPGVIKLYQYRFVPYLLAENPNMTGTRARELSTLMSEGEKLHTFGLDCSFMGWHAVGLLLQYILVFMGLPALGGFVWTVYEMFIAPYVFATEAELYAAMRAKAFAGGYTDAGELGDFIRY